MAEPSRPPNFKQYGVEHRCYGCGRHLTATEPRWFMSIPFHAVYGHCCFQVAARAS